MSYYEHNINTLLASAPYLKGIEAKEKSNDLDFFPTPAGEISGKYKGLYIHSRHNPVREAAQLIEREMKDDISCALFYGFGLGYHIEVFIKKYPKIPLLIIEPDISFFLKVLESRDFSHLFLLQKVLYYINPDTANLLSFIEALPLSNIQIIKLRSIYEFHRDYYKQVDGIVSSYLSKKEVNVNTLKRFGKLWIRNLVRNIRHLAEKPGITLLHNSFKDLPCLVLASGPSLDDVLPFLPELKKKMVVISVDTSLKACLDHGVEPDFLIIVDPQYWNTRHLDWTKPQKPFLVSESSTHPRVFRFLKLKGFFASSFFPLGQFFESIAGEKGKIGAGGSVATAAWDLARILGASPVVMAGLDLGFPGKKTHFHGAYFEQTFHTISRRFLPMEYMSFKYLRDGQPFLVPANDGNMVLTDKRMIIYKWWFESQMNRYPSIKTVTLSHKGVAIPGMEGTAIQDLLDLPNRKEFIDEKINMIHASTEQDKKSEERYARLKKAIRELIDNLHSLSVIADQGIETTRKAISSLKGGKISRSLLEQLNTIDEKITSESSRIIAGFLIQPIIQGLVHTSIQNKTPEQILEYSEKLYTDLKDSCEYHYKELVNTKNFF
ncbi:MAG: motility associated factor glycosyltransferase family protein [Spirochaetales bacterium]|nr:motility associated factor glycosyltransferase family protein [Spirochaetales bacterium]